MKFWLLLSILVTFTCGQDWSWKDVAHSFPLAVKEKKDVGKILTQLQDKDLLDFSKHRNLFSPEVQGEILTLLSQHSHSDLLAPEVRRILRETKNHSLQVACLKYLIPRAKKEDQLTIDILHVWKSSSTEVKTNCAMLLGAAGDLSITAAPALILEWNSTKDVALRSNIIWSLSRIFSAEGIVDYLQTAKKEEIACLIKVLGQYSRIPNSTRDILFLYAKQKNTALNAIQALGALDSGSKEVFEFLIERLKTDEQDLHFVVMTSMMRMRLTEEMKVQLLLGSTEQTSEFYRAKVLEILRQLRGSFPEVCPLALEAVQSTDMTLFKLGCLALQVHGKENLEVGTRLFQLLRQTSSEAQILYLCNTIAYLNLGDATVKWFLENTNEQTRYRISFIWVKMKAKAFPAVPLILQTIANSSESMCCNFLVVLAQVGEFARPALPIVLDHLSHNLPRVRGAAAWSAGQLAFVDPDLVRSALQNAQAKESDPRVSSILEKSLQIAEQN